MIYIHHTEEAYTALLLTLPLTRSTDELVRPLSGVEFEHIFTHMQGQPLSKLHDFGIDQLREMFDMTQDEAYRVCILLDRDVLLMHQLEECGSRDIDVVCALDFEYPERLRDALGGIAAPPLFFFGSLKLLHAPCVGIVGASGIKTPDMFKQNIRVLIPWLKSNGLALCTSGDPGACYHARALAIQEGVRMALVMNGGMTDWIASGERRIAARRGQEILISAQNPFAPFAAEMQSLINRLIYSQSQAAFVATLPAKHSELEALRKQYCPFMYAFVTPENVALIEKGFSPISELTFDWLTKKAEIWQSARAEQLSFL